MGADWKAMFLPTGLAVITLGLLASRAFRADALAMLALAAAVATGLVAPAHSLDGFSDPIVVTIGALVVLAAGVHRSGLVDGPRAALHRRWRLTLPVLLACFCLVALLAAISGRVGTRTALLRSSRLPDGAAGASRPVLALNLACLLGGTVTVVGGVPNLLASAVRADWLGAPFPVLAFAPAGLLLLLVGLLVFTATSLATSHDADDRTDDAARLRHVSSFTAEMVLPPGSPLAGRPVAALEAAGEQAFRVTALVREGFRRIDARPDWLIEPGDVLVLDCQPADIHRLVERYGMQPADGSLLRLATLSGLSVVEAVVTGSSALIGRTPPEGPLTGAAGLHLLGIGRNDAAVPARLRRTRLRGGDILALAAETEGAAQALSALGCLPLNERRLRLADRRLAALPVVALLLALAAAALGLAPLWLALLGGVLALVLSGLFTLAEVYEKLPWPGLVMLAALLPLATAIHAGPAPAAAAHLLATLAPPTGWPMVAAALAAAIAGSLLFGSAVTVLLLAPFAVALAPVAAVSPDALLMAVAIGASVDMLDGRGMVATAVPAPGRRPIPFWPAGAGAACLLLLGGTLAVAWVWLR